MPYRKDNTESRQRWATNLGAPSTTHGQAAPVVPATQRQPVDRSATAGVAKPRPSAAAGQAERAEDVAQQPRGRQEQISSATRQAELQQLCQRLQATHRCSGRCVFTGELRRLAWDL
jgi:hypothetical protein